MSNQTQKELKPQREKWFVFLYPAFFGLGLINEFNIIALAKLTVINQKLDLREFPAFFSRFQLTPQQVFKIAPSKIIYFSMAFTLPFLLVFILIPLLAFSNPISTTELDIFILAAILIIISPVIFLKCFKIQYKTHTKTGHIYFCCLRHQSRLILNALTRCGFGDKLEQPHSPSHSE